MLRISPQIPSMTFPITNNLHTKKTAARTTTMFMGIFPNEVGFLIDR
ncbi:hypothetical protein NXW40_17600 [Parabacteroides distasonis]|nr:hypothetical protein [Parabacteroides merdae]UVP75173.1 hypothetical protein NXW40_17600 [Parabacteroides distasonis]